MNKSNCMSYLAKNYPMIRAQSIRGKPFIVISSTLNDYDKVRFCQTEMLIDGQPSLTIFPEMSSFEFRSEEDLKRFQSILEHASDPVKGGNRSFSYINRPCPTSYLGFKNFLKHHPEIEITASYYRSYMTVLELLYPEMEPMDALVQYKEHNVADEMVEMTKGTWYVFDLVVPEGWNSRIYFQKVPHRYQSQDKTHITILTRMSAYVPRRLQKKREFGLIASYESLMRGAKDDNQLTLMIEGYLRAYYEKDVMVTPEILKYVKEGIQTSSLIVLLSSEKFTQLVSKAASSITLDKEYEEAGF